MSASPHFGFYWFYGPNRSAKIERIESLRASVPVAPLDYHRLEAGEISGAEFANLARSNPSSSPLRLIVVDRADKISADWAEHLTAQKDAVLANCCMIFLAEKALKTTHPLKFLKKQLQKESFELAEDPASKPFALVEAIGRRDASRSLYVLHQQLQQGKEPFELIGLIAWQLQRWMHLRRLLDTGYSGQRLAKALGVSAWQAKKLQEEVRWRTQPQLSLLLEKTWDCDTAMKTGRAQPLIAMEQLLFELCTAR